MSDFPSKKIGQFLKNRRQALHESIAEVSGAVEIDIDLLQNIESGSVLPSEDILLLLISHFEISENQAMKLLDIAGYDKVSASSNTIPGLDEKSMKQLFMMVPVDNRILYSNGVDVSVTKNGIVLNFLQQGVDGKASSVSRIGMSKEQLVDTIGILQASLTMTQPKKERKQLPSSTKKKHVK